MEEGNPLLPEPTDPGHSGAVTPPSTSPHTVKEKETLFPASFLTAGHDNITPTSGYAILSSLTLNLG